MNFLTESEASDYSVLSESDDYMTESLEELILEGSNICLPGTCKEECNKYIMDLLAESFDATKTFKFNF